jgi:phosphoserine phosphatase
LKAEIKLPASAYQFVESVVALKPSVAVFDCDDTLWLGDSGADFFYWEIDRGLVPAELAKWAVARYADYKAGKVDEETMCGEMVTINAGLPVSLLEEAAEEFYSTVVEGSGRIFPEMQQLTHELKNAGCDLWAISSTNEWSIRAGVKRFGIPTNHVLAASVEIANGRATDRLIRVPTDEGKARAIREMLREAVDVCAGNSIHDAAMLELATHSFAVNPTPELETIAQECGWKIYWPVGSTGRAE